MMIMNLFCFRIVAAFLCFIALLSFNNKLQAQQNLLQSKYGMEGNYQYIEIHPGAFLKTPQDGAEYLIISPNGQHFILWANALKQFRMQQGFLSKVVTIDEIGSNTVNAIENYINNAYNTWTIPPMAVLLLGDDGDDPENSIKAPVWDNYCVSDNIYADVDEDDLPDLIISRICAHTEIDLENTVGKIINYETNPPLNPEFYLNPIISLSFQAGGIRQIIGESVAGFFEVISNKTSNRIYTATLPIPEEWTSSPEGLGLVAYFGPEGLGYIPASPTSINSTWNGTTGDIINGLNEGSFMALYIGQGDENGWTNPPFDVNDLSALNNELPSFFWSCSTLGGKFNQPEDCFAEALLNHPSGALGVVAASEIYFATSAELLTMGGIDQLWPEYLPDINNPVSPAGLFPAVALASGKYYLDQNPWPINANNKSLIYHTFHYFGDALSCFFSEIPQALTVVHPVEISSFTNILTVSANQGSLIGITINDEIVLAATATGEEMEIPLPQIFIGDTIYLTVTKQNYLRYSANIPVTDEGTSIQTKSSKLHPLKCFPNPADKGFFMVEISNPEMADEAELSLLDMQMNLIYQKEILLNNNEQFKVECGELKNGIYFLKIENSNSRWVSKIVIL